MQNHIVAHSEADIRAVLGVLLLRWLEAAVSKLLPWAPGCFCLIIGRLYAETEADPIVGGVCDTHTAHHADPERQHHKTRGLARHQGIVGNAPYRARAVGMYAMHA